MEKDNVMKVQETVMAMMSSQLEMLEVELNDAYASLGKASMDKHNNDGYSMYFERKDFCTVCEEKVRLMKRLMDKISGIYGNQMPMLAKI